MTWPGNYALDKHAWICDKRVTSELRRLTMTHTQDPYGIAGGALAASLISYLVGKGILQTEEAATIVQDAIDSINVRPSAPGSREAVNILEDLINRLSEHRI
jgi:hypothetical protein